jgi:hypothetical protein
MLSCRFQHNVVHLILRIHALSEDLGTRLLVSRHNDASYASMHSSETITPIKWTNTVNICQLGKWWQRGDAWQRRADDGRDTWSSVCGRRWPLGLQCTDSSMRVIVSPLSMHNVPSPQFSVFFFLLSILAYAVLQPFYKLMTLAWFWSKTNHNLTLVSWGSLTASAT